MLAIPKAGDGACPHFCPTANVGVVPVLTDHPPVQVQYQVTGALGSVQLQRGTGEFAVVNCEVVSANVQVFIVPLTSVFMFKYGVAPGVVISGNDPPIAIFGPSMAAIDGVPDCVASLKKLTEEAPRATGLPGLRPPARTAGR